MKTILEYVPEPSIAEVVQASVLAGNLDSLQRQIEDYKAKPVNTYRNFEAEVNRLGYSLMAEGKIEAAIQVFKLNVNAYPHSANVYDSLGEAYAHHGDKQLAIQNYRKSLEVNPENEHAAGEISRLARPN
jgi:tetratricopeptide (TPR) repeat protein